MSLPDYTRSIHHDGSARYVQNKSAAGADPRLGDEMTVRLRVAPNAPVERVLLRTAPDGEQSFTEMRLVTQDAACHWWEGVLRMTMPVVGYRFLLFAHDGSWWYNGSGVHAHSPTDAEDFRLLAGYAAPTWVRDAVFYQIFPDRFADGDPGTNVHDGEWIYWGVPARARRWGDPPTARGPEALCEFYGGDLAGIEQHLDYVADLGVNALYLNPVFTALSNHRYDVTDYANVDPHLGGNAALVSLRRATGERGMRLMLDIVPNHCGVEHPWFKSARANADAPVAGYFTFHHHPDAYATWLGVRGLPKLNYASGDLRELMYAGQQSVFRAWLRPPYSIDGWRIDVANMLARQGADQRGPEIARGIRDAVKQENPQAYLLGESFFDATAALQGDAWDAVMNYAGFAMPVWYWLARFQVRQHGEPHDAASPVPWSTQALVDSWQAFRAAIPWVIARQQFNLIGSHDTPRIRTVVAGNRALERLAVALAMTYIGVPSVYYGDEVGLGGEMDTTARGCMPWDPSAWDQEFRAFYQSLIRLRRASPALWQGGFQVLAVEDNLLAFLRDSDTEQIIVVGQRGPTTRDASALPVAHGAAPNGLEFVEVLTGARATVVNGCLPLPAMPPGVAIWRTSFS